MNPRKPTTTRIHPTLFTSTGCGLVGCTASARMKPTAMRRMLTRKPMGFLLPEFTKLNPRLDVSDEEQPAFEFALLHEAELVGQPQRPGVLGSDDECCDRVPGVAAQMPEQELNGSRGVT